MSGMAGSSICHMGWTNHYELRTVLYLPFRRCRNAAVPTALVTKPRYDARIVLRTILSFTIELPQHKLMTMTRSTYSSYFLVPNVSDTETQINLFI